MLLLGTEEGYCFSNTPASSPSQPKSAGVLLLGTGGRINPHSIEYMETACEIKDNVVLHPFAFRTHTHSLGKHQAEAFGEGDIVSAGNSLG